MTAPAAAGEPLAAAARRLLDARRLCRPLTALPEGERPADSRQAYALQAAVFAATGRRPIGWKLGATSPRAQALLGLEGPFHGRLFAETTRASPARLPAEDFIFRLIEPEIAFTLARDLPAGEAPWNAEQLAAAVALVHPAFEVVAPAFDYDSWIAVGGPSIIADAAAHGAFVLGPGVSDWRGLDLAGLPVRLAVDGEPFGEGSGAQAYGGPLRALAWLADTLAAEGRGLAAGEIVTTGVVTPFPLLQAGQTAEADFGPLGCIRLSFD